MSKKQENPLSINGETIVELISIKGEKVHLNLMKYNEALRILQKKKPGWSYLIYQKGFSQFSNIIKSK